MKRIIDILLASISLVCFMPILISVALAVFLQDYGQVIFRQRRVGLNGREFTMFKFRSMVLNAERLGGYSTADRDPRITPVGRFIRRTSLDELPQLINVLIGDMSIVGPRPDVPAQRQLYTEDEWILRNRVRPGITGLAQATVRSHGTMEETKYLDLYYVRNISLWLDIKIIFLTIRQVLLKGGN